MMAIRAVSVVVNTFNRAKSLQLTLEALRHLDYPQFEVIVVAGPSDDSTDAVLDAYHPDLEVRRCPDRNLSTSRNIGIAAAGGEIVAFIDDDAYPDPRWLDHLVPAFDDPEVAAAGGPVWDHTGAKLQAATSFANRWGHAWTHLEWGPTSHLLHPDAWVFPYTMGTNSLFRRAQLVAIGGFDERYSFYLEETDVCLRLIDRGYVVATLDRGYVYHKFLSSAIRNDNRVTTHLYDVIHSRAYFSARHGLPRSNRAELAVSYGAFVTAHRNDLNYQASIGLIGQEDLHRFEDDVARATELGFDDACEPPLTRTTEWFGSPREPFHPFPATVSLEEKLQVAIVTEEYRPGPMSGIARICYDQATTVAARGHTVHVITSATAGHDTVDFEEGVWVHRIVSRPHQPPPEFVAIPERWDRAATVYEEVQRIREVSGIDVVQTTGREGEGLPLFMDRSLPCVAIAWPPIRSRIDGGDRSSSSGPAVQALMEAQRLCYQQADIVIASSEPTMEAIEEVYALQIPPSRRRLIPVGIKDLPIQDVRPVEGRTEVLFVEPSSATDEVEPLLDLIPSLVQRIPSVLVTIAANGFEGGDDRGSPDEKRRAAGYRPLVGSNVQLVGEVEDEEWLRLCARCDIVVVTPQLQASEVATLEAMRFARAIVITGEDGIASPISHGRDGLVAMLGDSEALIASIVALAEDEPLRRRLGDQARETFRARFTADRMADRTIELLGSLRSGTRYPPRG
jgi:glycosyltransferase involved in cell wall biosynthesis